MISEITSALSYTIDSGLFVDEVMHGFVTIPFVLFLYFKTKSIKYSLIPLLVTYLIDMDHWVDYLLFYGNNINLVSFVSLEYFDISSRAIVPLHAWEWLLLISAVAFKKRKWKSIYTAVAFGMLAHLIWDSHTVGSVIFYSILYRISNNFLIIL